MYIASNVLATLFVKTVEIMYVGYCHFRKHS